MPLQARLGGRRFEPDPLRQTEVLRRKRPVTESRQQASYHLPLLAVTPFVHSRVVLLLHGPYQTTLLTHPFLPEEVID